MATVTLKDIRKSYGDVEIIKGVNLSIEDREFCVFVGPSGCGKSTLLRMIAGLEEITAGDLAIDGARANDVPPSERGLAMVFQTYALYPHMSVADNMGFSLRLAGVPKAERRAKVGEAARILHLEQLLTGSPRSFQADSGSGSRSGGRSSGSRRCSCSTSRSRTWTRRSGCRCGSSWRGSTTSWPPR
jgi:multiple sugar transport system ATP-binding protein